MKTKYFFLTLFLTLHAFSQYEWTKPIQITFGLGDDVHPAFIKSHAFFYNEVSFAFSRSNSVGGSDICIMKTNKYGQFWIDTTYYITFNDTTKNDFPTYARNYGQSFIELKMLLWTRDKNISYIYFEDSVIKSIGQLTHDSNRNEFPCVTGSNNGFGAVWQKLGVIEFSEFFDSAWSEPITIDRSDTLNSHPVVCYFENKPVVVWEKRKVHDSTRSIFYSVRTDSGWTISDTLTTVGDNRNPRFSNPETEDQVVITWESNRTGDWDVFISESVFSIDKTKLVFQSYNVSQDPLSDDIDACFTYYILVGGNSSSIYPNNALFWRTIHGESDSIASYPFFSYFSDSIRYLTPVVNSVDRHPDISEGVYPGVWCIWENNNNGVWKIYGETTNIWTNVNDDNFIHPNSFSLSQNFPNPFNPTTTIRFTIHETQFTTLKIYDIFGREVATLVNENLQAGNYERKWDATGIPSGMYFYRLASNNFSETKKLLLLK